MCESITHIVISIVRELIQLDGYQLMFERPNRDVLRILFQFSVTKQISLVIFESHMVFNYTRLDFLGYDFYCPSLLRSYDFALNSTNLIMNFPSVSSENNPGIFFRSAVQHGWDIGKFSVSIRFSNLVSQKIIIKIVSLNMIHQRM